MKDRLRAFRWPHQVRRPRTGWLRHFRWIASTWLLLIFRDRVGLRNATVVAVEYVKEALSGWAFRRILVDTKNHPVTVTLPVGGPGEEYTIVNLGPHPVTVECSGTFSSLDVERSSWVSLIKRKSGWAVRR